MKHRIACLQMNSSSVVRENLDYVGTQLKRAKEEGVDLIQLPENFAQMPVNSDAQVIEIDGTGEIQAFLKAMAIDHQMSIIAGSIPIKAHKDSTKNPHARCVVVNEEGDRCAIYDKIHLFDVQLPSGKYYRESDRYSAGEAVSDNIVIAEVSGLRIGLSICYDLRFPELYRKLASQGVDLIGVPSAFTYDTGQAHWQTLLRSRAVENLSFVFAAAQTGVQANGRRSWGHSMIISPWGEIIAQADERPGLISAEIDLTELADIRGRFPALDHRQL